ncbi:MAG: MBL fold metallo-hydrolase [Anaerolineales bacterium]|jgi:glyoxylase-like metal-dependent hydrolase (beta-lactamase superfamily II)
MQVLPDIFLVDGVRGANCYLVSDEAGMLAVDSGMPGQTNRITDCIRGMGRKTDDLKWIVLTHADIDHSGSAAQLRQQTGAKLAAHEADAQVLAGKRAGKRPKGMLGLLFGVMRRAMPMPILLVDRILAEGDTIAGWQVLHTPGHTDGSICLYREGAILFAGDALRCDAQGNPLLPSGAMSSDMNMAMHSVRRIAALKFDTLLVGHGAPCLQQASQKLSEWAQP